jgi:hypothetical protein
MKWFERRITDKDDLEAKLIERKFGLTGYAIWEKLQSIVAENMEGANTTDWGYVAESETMESLANKIRCSLDQFREFVKYCDDNLILEKRNGRLFCNYVLERMNEYARKVVKKEKTEKPKNPEKPETPELGRNNTTQHNTTHDILNNDQSSDELSLLKKDLGIPEEPTKGIHTEFQAEAVRIAKALGAPQNRYSAYMKAVKEDPRSLILSAFAFAEDYDPPSARDKMFFFQLNKLKQEKGIKNVTI